MFTTTSIYFLMLFLIFWCYCGYLILLIVFTTVHSNDENEETVRDEVVKMAVLIPCYNEEVHVKKKIENLKELEYDANKIEFFFLNGISTDNTSGEISRLTKNMNGWNLVETGCIGKIRQINYGLALMKENFDVVVCTDMDTMLAPDVLVKLSNEFQSDRRIAVVGANISPGNCISLEEDYWRDQNLLRIIESKVYTSTIVVAPCYAFRAFLIDRFPEDCIADDIFVAFKANTEGYITRYIQDATGVEVRTPSSFDDFFQHKFRKGNAYLIELFRFFYRLPQMSGWWKVIYLTKVLQLAVIPWVLPYFALSTISLALSGWGPLKVALFGFVSLFCSVLMTSFMMKRTRGKYLQIPKERNRLNVPLFLLGNLILVLVGLTFPFYKQSSSYRKINQNEKVA